MDPALATKIVATAEATKDAAKARKQQNQIHNEKAKKKAKKTGVEREKKQRTSATGALHQRRETVFTVEDVDLTALGTLALGRAGRAAAEVGVHSVLDSIRDNENMIAEQRLSKANAKKKHQQEEEGERWMKEEEDDSDDCSDEAM